MKAKKETVKKVKVVKPKNKVKKEIEEDFEDYSFEDEMAELGYPGEEPEPISFDLIVDNGSEILFKCNDGYIYAYEDGTLYRVKVLKGNERLKGPNDYYKGIGAHFPKFREFPHNRWEIFRGCRRW